MCSECMNILCRRTIPAKKFAKKENYPLTSIKAQTSQNDANTSENHPALQPKRTKLHDDPSTKDAPCHTTDTSNSDGVLADTIKYLQSYQYVSALRSLAKSSQRGKQAIISVALEIAKKEVGYTDHTNIVWCIW